MILIIIQMKVDSEIRKDLSQEIETFSDSINKEKGSKGCDFFRSFVDENILILFEE